MSQLPCLSVSDEIPKVCTVNDVCRALNISRTQLYTLMRTKRFPIPEILPRLGRGPRFRGVDVELYLDGHYAAERSTRRIARVK